MGGGVVEGLPSSGGVFGVVAEFGAGDSAGGLDVCGVLGEVDCCFEHADTSASALKSVISMIRFIDLPRGTA